MSRPTPKKPPTFAARLTQLREQAGLSPVELATRAGMARAVVSRLESGKRLPSWETLVKLADALDVSLSVFDACRSRKPESLACH